MSTEKKSKKKKGGKHYSLRQAVEQRLLFDASLIAPAHDVGAPPAEGAAAHDATQATQGEATAAAKATADSPQAVQPASDRNPVDNTSAKDGKTFGEELQEKDASNTSKLQEFHEFTPAPKEIVFIDSRVKDAQTLLQGMSPSVEVYFIDAKSDGISQIDKVLNNEKSPVAAIHILSHGSSGALELGDSVLNTQTLRNQYASDIASWNSHLTSDANILLYGCGVAEGNIGRQFVSNLAEVSGANIAASIDATGSTYQHANWSLEYSTGDISYNAEQIFSAEALNDFYTVFAKPVVDLNGLTNLTVSDNFASGLYTGGTSNLTTTWSGGWTEFDASPTRAFTPGGSTNSDNSPVSGNIVDPAVASGGTVSGLGTGAELAFLGHTQQYGDSIERGINLKSYTYATVSFDYRTAGLTSADAIQFEVSTNAGANFVTLGTLSNVTSNTNISFDISNYVSDNMVIKFSVNKGFDQGSYQQFFVDNVTINAEGNNYVTTFSEQTGAAVSIADAAAAITDADVGQLIKTANISLANMKAGDQFVVGALPSGITSTIDNVNGTVTLQSTAGASSADFATAIRAVKFQNTSATLDTTTRSINVTVTDSANETSFVSTSFVKIAAYDNPVTSVAHSVTVSTLGVATGSLFDNSSLTAERTQGTVYDYDPDTAGLSASILAQGTKGVAVINPDGTFTYTPNVGATPGTDTFTYTLTSQAQVIGVNYEYWSSAISSLKTGFPSGAPTATGFLSGFDVDQVAINSGNAALDNFVVRFNNTLNVETAGSYTFYSGSDDGSLVYVDGNLVVDNDGAHSFLEKNGTISLAAGEHTVQVLFFENGGQEDLFVSYLGPDTAGLKTNLGDVGSVLASTTTTGSVSVTVQDTGPRLALGTNLYTLDNFSTNVYTRNDGTLNWSGNWTEVNETTSATSGHIIVTGGELRVRDTSGGGRYVSISRAVDLGLSGSTLTRVATQLSFDYDATGANANGVIVQVSTDGGSNWISLMTISNATSPSTGTQTIDLSGYDSSAGNLIVRFYPSSGNKTNPVLFDNVRVDTSTVNNTAATFIENGSPVAIASGNTVIADSSANMNGAVITISNAQAGDLLSYDNSVAGISASFVGNTLTLSGTATRAQYMTALQHVFYSNTSDNPATTTRSINVSVKDSANVWSNTATTTVAVTAVNDAPVGIDGSATVSLNTTYILKTADFAFTDVEGDALQAVTITTLPGVSGTLQLDTTGSGNWVNVSANQSITAADIAAGRLRFVPATNTAGVTQFTFQVQDTGGTANGGVNLDASPNTFAIRVLTGPNTAPTLTSDLTLVSSAEDNFSPTPRTISQLVSDSGANVFSDPDASAVLKGLAIVGNSANAATQGVWQYSTDGANWYAVGTVGDNASSLALVLSASTQVRFVPVADYNGTPPSLTIRAIDDTYAGTFTSGNSRTTINSGTNGGSSAISGSTREIVTNVTPVNDAPSLTPGNPTLNSISAAQTNNAGQLVSDFLQTSAGSNRTVVTDIDTGALQGIAIINAAGTKGTWEYSTDNGATWNSVGNVSVTSALLLRSTDKVRFNPDGVNPGSGALTYRAWDQTSGSAGTQASTASYGGTTAFSVLTDTATITTTSPLGPTLANTSTPLAYIENAAAGVINSALTITDSLSGTLSSAQISLANFVSGQDILSFTNTGSTAMGNIAASYNSTTGVLTLTSSGATATLAQWQTALRAVKYSNSSDAPNTTTRTVNYQVNDSTGAISNTLSTTLDVTAVNDAPSGADKTINLTRSAVYVFKTADFGFSDLTDNSANTLNAVQITTLPTTGTLTNNGVTVSVNSFISAADIAAGKLIYTAANADATRTLSFKVQDTGGTANGGVDLDPTANTITLSVLGTNTAPSFASTAGRTLTSITEDSTNNSGQTVASFMGTINDVDAGALKGVAITTTPSVVNGVWQYSIDGGTTWANMPAVSATNVLLLRDIDLVRFQPNEINGGTSTFTFRAWDQTTGTAGASVNPGSSTAFSASGSPVTATIVVTSINDAPTVTAPVGPYSATEQVNLTLSGPGLSIADVDAGTASMQVTLAVGEGILTASAGTTGVTITNSGTGSVTLSGTLTQINALLSGSSGGSVIYNDNLNAPAAMTNLTLTVNDLGNTGSGGALSTSIVRTINITAMNDAPTLTGTVGGTYVENGASIAIVSGTITAGEVDSSNFNTGILTAAFSSYVPGDILSINNQGTSAGQIGVSGSNITYGGTIIGTFTGGSASNLQITLNSNATSTSVQALVTQLRYSSSSEDPTAGGTANSRAMTVTLNDNGVYGAGGALTASISGTINVTAYDDAPVVTATPTGNVFIEGAGSSTGAAASFFSGATVSAIESGQTIKSLTFTVGGLLNGASEQIVVDGTTILLGANSSGTTVTNGMSYSVSISSGTATVVLSKTAGVASANIATLINNIGYQNTSQDPTAGTRTATLTQIVDSGSSTAPNVNTTALAIASNITVVPVNDGPILTATSIGGTFTEGAGSATGSAVSLFSGVSVSTVESGQTITSLTFTVGNVQNGSSEVINVDGSTISLIAGTGTTATNGMSYSVTVSGGTATVILSKAGGVSSANAASVINGLTYQNISQNPTSGARTVTLTQIKDSGGTANGGVDTTGVAIAATVNVMPINDAPVLSGTSSITYTENAAATPINTSISLSDVDSATLSSATVAITNFVSGQDILSFVSNANTGNITASFNAVTGVLTLTSVDNSGTPAQFEAALRAVQYSNSSDNPTTTARDITFVVNDGSVANNLSSVVHSTVNLTAVNDAPVLSGTSNITYTENAAATVINSGISLSDVDSATLSSATVAITNFVSGQDILSFVSNANTGNITASFNAVTGVLTLTSVDNSGTPAQFEAALRAVKYANSSDNPTTTARDITFVVNDGSAANNLSSVVHSTVNLTAVNDAPVLAGASTINYTENDAATIINDHIALNDTDNATLANAVVAISNYQAGEDILSFTPNPPATGNITGSFNATTGILTLISNDNSGTPAQFEAALRSVKYSNTSDHPATAARDITFVVNDGGSTNNLSDVVHSTVNVIAVNDAPVLSGPAQTIDYVANEPAKIIDPTMTVTDIDVPANFNGGYLQISITAGLTANDQLSIDTTQSGITHITVSGNNVMYNGASFGTIDSVMNGANGHELKISFNANASADAVQALSRTIAFSNDASIASTASRTVVYELHDGGNVGTGGDLVAYKANTVSVTRVPNPPAIISIPENLGNGINMEEVQSNNGSEINISLNGTGANSGDMLTVNWGNSVIVYSLTNADIAANQANILIPTAAILAEGDGAISVTAKITNQSNKTSGLSSPVDAFVDTYVAQSSTDAQSASNTNPILLTGKLSGTVQAGDQLTVQVGSLRYAINMSAGARTWAVEIPANMPAGVYTVTTTLRDPVGNLSQTVGSGMLIIEASAGLSESNVSTDLPITYRTDAASASMSDVNKNASTIAKGIIDSRAPLVAKSNVVGSWGWYHMPEFVDLNPIVKGLSQTVDVLIKNDNGADPVGARNVLNTFSTKPISYADYQVSQRSSTDTTKESTKVSELNVLNALNTTTNSAEKTASIVKEVIESKQASAGKTTFQAKIKNLLKDFGIDE